MSEGLVGVAAVNPNLRRASTIWDGPEETVRASSASKIIAWKDRRKKQRCFFVNWTVVRECQFVDRRWVEELHKSGFIKKLYR